MNFEDCVDHALIAMMQPLRHTPTTQMAEPDFAQIHQELKRKGMTLQLPSVLS